MHRLNLRPILVGLVPVLLLGVAVVVAVAVQKRGDESDAVGNVRHTDFNGVRVTHTPATVVSGSPLTVSATGLGSEQIWLYLIKSEEIYDFRAHLDLGDLVVLGMVRADSQGRFVKDFTVEEFLTASGGGRSVRISPGSWTLALGWRTASASSYSTFGQLAVEAPQ